MNVGQKFHGVDLSVLHGREPGGETATLTVRFVYTDAHPVDGAPVQMCDAVDDVYGREHDYLMYSDIEAAQA